MKSPSSEHNQPVSDPIAHFKAIPWCNVLLSAHDNVATQVPDRTPIRSTESSLVRETMNTESTVKACVTYFRYLKPTKESQEAGETKEKPFLEMVALLDLGRGVNGYAGTAHGGFDCMVLDEVCGTVANMQSDYGAYTATLDIKFKKPIFTPAIVVCRGRVVKKQGRKAFVIGSFEDKDGVVLTEAEGVWSLMNHNVGRSNVPSSKL